MALNAFVIGMRLLTCQRPSSRRWLTATGALLSLALSASLRPIYAPVMIVSGVALMLIQHGMCASEETSRLKRSRFQQASRGADRVWRAPCGQLLECILLNHSRTSQYAPVWCAQWSPLAMIGDGKETCGRWSESRARFGLDRRSEPLVPFILDRQREVGWKNLPVLYACKISRLLGFRDWFASWLEGSQRYRQDRILADSMGWMCRRWMRRRNKVMLTELTRCDSPMRRVPGCLSKPLIGSGHVANHDCVVSCRVDDGASACQVASIWFVRAWRFSCSGRGVDRFARRILRGASALRLSCLGASPVFMTLIGKVTDSGFLAQRLAGLLCRMWCKFANYPFLVRFPVS